MYSFLKKYCFHYTSPLRRLKSTVKSSTIINKSEHHERKKESSNWCLVSGFSKYSSREDLNRVLKGFNPLRIDPLIDKEFIPQGSYFLQFKSAEEAESLKKYLDKKFPKYYKLNIVKRNGSGCFSFYQIQKNTVLISNLPPKTPTSSVLSFFSKFNLLTLNLRIIYSESGNLSYLIQFSSYEEASRAVTELSHKTFDGKKVFLLHYRN